MNAIVIIKKDQGMDNFGHDAMANTIGICDCILKDATDGDEVTATIKGTLIEHDGMRFISVDTVDGESVEDPEMALDQNPDEGAMDAGAPPDHLLMDAEDALMNFMQNRKGK